MPTQARAWHPAVHAYDDWVGFTNPWGNFMSTSEMEGIAYYFELYVDVFDSLATNSEDILQKGPEFPQNMLYRVTSIKNGLRKLSTDPEHAGHYMEYQLFGVSRIKNENGNRIISKTDAANFYGLFGIEPHMDSIKQALHLPDRIKLDN